MFFPFRSMQLLLKSLAETLEVNIHEVLALHVASLKAHSRMVSHGSMGHHTNNFTMPDCYHCYPGFRLLEAKYSKTQHDTVQITAGYSCFRGHLRQVADAG